MRTDAIIDKRQVRLPNASTIGYGKWKAQVGDLLTFRESADAGLSHGRMIGRVHYASNLAGGQPIRDYILVLVLNNELNHTYERWVDPKTVERCESLQENTDRRALLAYFLSDDLIKSPIDEVRQSTEFGALTIQRYREYMGKRARDLSDYEARHKGCNSAPCDFCQKFGLHGSTEASV